MQKGPPPLREVVPFGGTYMDKKQFVAELEKEWKTAPRWKGIARPYTAEEVHKLKGNIHREYSIAKASANRLWKLLKEEKYVNTLSAVTGNQAIQQVRAGLKAIYVSG